MVRMIMGTRGLYKLGDYIYKDGKIFKHDNLENRVDELKYPDVPCKDITEKELIEFTQSGIRAALKKIVENRRYGAL